MLIAYTSGAEHIAEGLKRRNFDILPNAGITFTDGEHKSSIGASNVVRGKDVLVLYSRHIDRDPNADYAEFIQLLRNLKAHGSSVKYVFFLCSPYQRQDSDPQEGTTFSDMGSYNAAKGVVDDLIIAEGVARVFALDPHFSNKGWAKEYAEGDNLRLLTIENLLWSQVLADFGNTVIQVAPDMGAGQRYGLPLGQCLAKKRMPSGKVELDASSLTIDLAGKVVAIRDDIIASGETTDQAIKLLREKGAKKVVATAVHGTILSGIEKVTKSVDKLYLANTIKTPYGNVDITDAVAEVLRNLE